MTCKDRLFFMIYGAIAFPLIIVGCTVAFKWNASIIIPSLLTFVGSIKWLLEKDSNCNGKE